jgi:spermidine/putrescine ABC transporter ATP-binding subunit
VQIELKNVTKRFGQTAAVNNVNLTIQEGELFTLLGPSGCGKTTSLRLVAGFYTPDEGEVLFNGRVVNTVPPDQRGIGMVFQNYALWPHMTVFQNVAYGLKLQKIGRAEANERVNVVLNNVELQGFGDRYPGQLSGGQQQRVALARALVLNPKILLLDEPLSNLDAKIRVQVRQEIRKLQKDLGITTIYVTHDQEEALTLSDRIAVFNHGQVFQVGPPKELYERPANYFVADFIGINNLFEGTVESVDPTNRQLAVKTALGTLHALYDERFAAGSPCVVCIRPENGSIGGEPAPDRNLADGKITFAAYLGNTLRYDVELASGAFFKVDIRDPWHHVPLPMGSAVTVGFPAASTVVIGAER